MENRIAAASLQIIKASSKYEYARCVQVRTQVFVIGQNVPPDREIDSYEDDCTHFLALWDGVTTGAVRWRRYENGAKLERLAVLESFRGRKIGQALTQAVLDDIKALPRIAWVRLGSQQHAINFYNAFGFAEEGETYEDGGGIPHRDMVMSLSNGSTPSFINNPF